jgi:hypothetical protein
MLLETAQESALACGSLLPVNALDHSAMREALSKK